MGGTFASRFAGGLIGAPRGAGLQQADSISTETQPASSDGWNIFDYLHGFDDDFSFGSGQLLGQTVGTLALKVELRGIGFGLPDARGIGGDAGPVMAGVDAASEQCGQGQNGSQDAVEQRNRTEHQALPFPLGVLVANMRLMIGATHMLP